MIYDIGHRTTFSYTANVDISQHLLHLAPRPCQRQIVHRHVLLVTPTPTLSKDGKDYFGNPTTYLTVEQPHDELTIASNARVEIYADAATPAPETTPAWEEMADRLGNAGDLDAQQYVFESPFTQSKKARDYAVVSFPPGRPVLVGAIDLMRRIFEEFKYEGGVTDIYTPVDRVMAERRGVCQDFAHLQIACLRALMLPARYVSGYLMTHPPEGKEKLIGSDASHAWLAVWTGAQGWVDLDPTNNLLPGDEHITVAWGRDYSDVSPIAGMVLGGGEQTIDVAVDVRPPDETQAPEFDR